MSSRKNGYIFVFFIQFQAGNSKSGFLAFKAGKPEAQNRLGQAGKAGKVSRKAGKPGSRKAGF